MKSNFFHLFSGAHIPKGVRAITFATSIRWIGWGFAESLIPIFIFSLAGSFAEAGLLRSAYDIGLILTLPLIGLFADRARASTLLLIGLFLYFFIGASYWLAGITGLAALIAVARLMNGVAYAFDSVGRATYFRRHTAKGKIATIFGYFDTVATFWWVIAAIIGIVLIKYFSIGLLLFMITPTAILAFFVIWRFRNQEKESIRPVGIARPPSRISFLKLMAGWDWPLRSLIILNFFLSCAAAVVAFFLPIEAYTEGAGLSLIILFGIVSAVPSLFGWELGKWFDGKGIGSFVFGLMLFGLLLLSIPFVDGYIWKLAVAFLAGLIIEFLSVGHNELVTVHASPEHFGQVDGVMRSIGYIGSMTGPLVIGIIMDSYGIGASYVTLGGLLLVLAAIFHVLGRSGVLKIIRPSLNKALGKKS